MTLAFWQAGDLAAAGRAVRDWARVDPSRPAAHRFAARIYEDMGAIDLAAEAADRAAAARPQDADAWERVGPAAPAAHASATRRSPRSSARGGWARASTGLLDLALAYHLAGDLGGEVTAVRAGDDAGSRLAAEAWVALRARARAHRPRERRASPPRARARASTAAIPTSPSCSSACARRRRACCRRRDRLGPGRQRRRGLRPAAAPASTCARGPRTRPPRPIARTSSSHSRAATAASPSRRCPACASSRCARRAWTGSPRACRRA